MFVKQYENNISIHTHYKAEKVLILAQNTLFCMLKNKKIPGGHAPGPP